MRLSEMLKKAGCHCAVIQDGEFEIMEQCTRIRAPKALTYLEKTKFIDALQQLDISCVICTAETVSQLPKHISGVAVTDEPKLVFFKLHNFLVTQCEKRPTVIDPTARISPQAYIAPYNVRIGENVEIQPFVMVNEHTTIEKNVRICAGSVVGDQSFTSVNEGNGVFLARDAGGTLIEEGVEICGCCHIACGTLQNDVTTIGAYSKLDGMVHVGHGTVIGRRTLLPSGAHVAGNCIVGNDTWIGVHATISNRIEIGDHARVSLGAVVTKNVPAGETVTGNFAIPHQKFMQNLKKSVEE